MKPLSEMTEDFVMASIYDPKAKHMVEVYPVKGCDINNTVFEGEHGELYLLDEEIPLEYVLILLLDFKDETWVEHTNGDFERMKEIAEIMNKGLLERSKN